MRKLLSALIMVMSVGAFAGTNPDLLQNDDFKSLADLTSNGSNVTHLLNDTKIYVSTTGITEQLSSAITDGNLFRAASVLTTKGDTPGFSTTTVRVPVGTDGQVYTADSTTATGTKWAAQATAPTDPNDLQNVGIKTSVSSSALTVTLTQADGSTAPSVGSPVHISLRGSTEGVGSVSLYNQRAVTSSISLTVPAGATLGCAAGNCYVYVYAIDNAGTVQLGVVSNYKLDESLPWSTATLNGSSNTSGGLYSPGSIVSSAPVRFLARLRTNEATPGQWVTNTLANDGPQAVDLRGVTFQIPQNNRVNDRSPTIIAGVIGCSASPTIISDPFGQIASITRNGGGDCTINFRSGFNAGAGNAICTCSIYNVQNNIFCLNPPGSVSATSYRIIGSLDGGGAVDTNWSFICVGANIPGT